MSDALERLTGQELRDLHDTLAALVQLKAKEPLSYFHPYPKQKDFFDLGATKRERLLQAGNQTGKSQAGAYETACHATGAYPPWWVGRRFEHPTQGWIAGESGQSVRDIAQTKLFGIPHDESSIGMIARELVISKSSSHGVADLFDTARIRHVSGGVSTITTKTYEQARGKWMGQTLDWIWLDEECPEGHYSEALARLTGPGVIWTTFTPLAGFTNVVGRFLRDDSEDARRDRGVVKMGLKDAEHFTAEEKQRRLAGYPAHERQARSEGDPTLGSGAIFDQLETTLSIGSGLRVPVHWAKLWGLDFGSSVFAAVLMAWDRDTDTIYVLDTVRLENSKPIEHVAAMRRKAPDVRVAWPSDGHSHERGSGETIISQYRRLGLLVLGSHACFPDGGVSVEAGLMEMAERMGDGRFRVMAHCADWFDEYRGYHRDTSGKIVKLRDHLLDATRYAVMSKRFARPGAIGGGLSEPRDFARRPTSPIAIGIDFDVFA